MEKQTLNIDDDDDDYPKYPTVPNALSGIPLLVCPVKHRQLHKGNTIHLNNQTKHGMSHFFQWL